MAVNVIGVLINGTTIIADTDIKFRALESTDTGSGEILKDTEFSVVTNASGEYNFTLSIGSYKAWFKHRGLLIDLGILTVSATTPSPVNLIELQG